MDVADTTFCEHPLLRDAEVAGLYADFWDTALSHPAVSVAMTWGITDRYSWLHNFYNTKRSDGRPSRGLIFDYKYQPKAAYYALLRAFRNHNL
jgi:endo-1,4-beta-xylanase